MNNITKARRENIFLIVILIFTWTTTIFTIVSIYNLTPESHNILGITAILLAFIPPAIIITIIIILKKEIQNA